MMSTRSHALDQGDASYKTLLGWPQGNWKSIDDWVERMHLDDRDYVVNFCVSQSQSGG
jgi:hypothetical protein